MIFDAVSAMPGKSRKMRGGPSTTPVVGSGSGPLPSMTTMSAGPFVVTEIDRMAVTFAVWAATTDGMDANPAGSVTPEVSANPRSAFAAT